MIDLRIGKYSFANVLTGSPKITDQSEAICRTLDFSVGSPAALPKLYGNPVELWYKGKCWFYGFLFSQDTDHSGQVSFKAYDPLYYMKKTPGDYYFKGQTASQGLQHLAKRVALAVGRIADTGAVLENLYYAGKTPDKIAIDLLARSLRKNGRKFWFRFNPDKTAGNFGLEVFERIQPKKAWAFQYGVNLTRASVKGSIEETTPVVRLVNREMGKEVIVVDIPGLKRYGHMVTFKEINKDEVKNMEAQARALLDKVNRPKQEQSIEGINPEGSMPMFWSGDVVYAEERHTELAGGYYIKNVTHTFSDKVIALSMDLVLQPDIPQVQYEDQKDDEKKIKASQAGDGVSSDEKYEAILQGLVTQYADRKSN